MVSQENAAIMRHHEAHGMFWLLCTGNTEEKHRNNAPATTAVDHLQIGAFYIVEENEDSYKA